MSTDGFFGEKRSWSRIKDAILASYLHAYLPKINKVSDEKILIIDAFAGPGKFDDGKAGSPLIICQAAEKYVPQKYEAIFINLEETHHKKLESILHKANFINAKPIHGDSREIIKSLHKRLQEPITIFLYLDPYGLKDVSFDLIRPFIERNPKYSTEILINLNTPALHRFASRNAFIENPESDKVKENHTVLSDVLGGDYWKPILLEEGIEPKEREKMIVNKYRKLLSSTGYLKYTGACPIQDSRDSQTKYYMIFASRHIDATKLFNDEMLRAFETHMTQKEYGDTLFADMNWKDWRDTKELENLVLEYVSSNEGKTRLEIWEQIVVDHFLRFSSSEYGIIVNALIESKKLESPTPRRFPNRLNKDCRLYITKG